MRPFIVAAVARVDTFVGSARASSLLVGIELARAALPHADPGRVLDRDEERHLLGRDPHLTRLPPELPPHAEQHRSQAVGNRQRVDPGVG